MRANKIINQNNKQYYKIWIQLVKLSKWFELVKLSKWFELTLS
jgi:hypothetical protein